MDIQQALKQETADLHFQAEDHPLMTSFKKGEYKKEHLLQVLVNLRPVYEVVEQRLLIPYIHKNFDLCRSRLISKDIATIYKEIINEDNVSYLKILPETREWVEKQWRCSVDLLVSDLYVRWLADFYGGRVFAKSLAPYNNTYSSSSPGKVIEDVRNIIAEHSQYTNWSFTNTNKQFYNYNWDSIDIKHTTIVLRAKAFFQYHIELFDTIYNQE